MKFQLIPKPQSFSVKSEAEVFTFSENTNFSFPKPAEAAVKSLCDFLEEEFQLEIFGGGGQTVFFEKDEKLTDEEYRLIIDKNRISVFFRDAAAAFYAAASLKQLVAQAGLSLPQTEITDYPQFSYRGFTLDSAKTFFPAEYVRRIIDKAALLKLNRFHWILSGDQGFRLELLSKPLLCQIGGFRAYSGLNKTPHGGFYTEREISEIVRYAKERFVEVIPEISVPNRAAAMIAAFPALSCEEKEISVPTSMIEQKNIICAGKDSAYEFTLSLLEEVRELFPSGKIHIGAGRASLAKWKKCPECRKKMRELSLSDETQLFGRYIKSIAESLMKNGAQVIVRYSEALEGLPQGVIFQLDEKCGEYVHSRPAVASFCLDRGAAKYSLKNQKVSGAQALLFSGFVSSPEKAEKRIFPRLALFASAVWNGENK